MTLPREESFPETPHYISYSKSRQVICVISCGPGPGLEWPEFQQTCSPWQVPREVGRGGWLVRTLAADCENPDLVLGSRIASIQQKA